MHDRLPAWQRNTLRMLAGSCLVALVWAIWQQSASAQGTLGTVEVENDDFFGNVLRNIFLFDTKGWMATLSKPQFAIPAFIVLNVIVFTETGLLIGFFLPGDSLLVITGVVCANPDCQWNLPLLLATLCASAILGDTVGYWIGYKAGPKIFNREKSLFFDKDHLLKAKAFYDNHGGKTIILARFMPFLRTFAPVVAGVGKMEYRQFLFFNVFGGISWVVSMVLAGRFLPELINPLLQPILGEQFHVAEHIEKVVVLIVILSVLPMIIGWAKGKLARTEKPLPPEAHAAVSEPALSVK